MDRYEALRKAGSGESSPAWERALFMSSGMIGWMKFCLTCRGASQLQQQAPFGGSRPVSLQEALPEGFNMEIARVVAQMVWVIYRS